MSVLWILGEAKSGKSELAEAIFARLPGKKFYIGTLPRTPQNMKTIRKHIQQRPEDWELIEIGNSLGAAVRAIGSNDTDDETAVLLDGWEVYAGGRASGWSKNDKEPSRASETRFVEENYNEYLQLVHVCDYLVVVAHVSAHPPTDSDYESDPITSRVRAITSQCIATADKVIYHDAEDISHKDRIFVEKIAAQLIAAE